MRNVVWHRLEFVIFEGVIFLGETHALAVAHRSIGDP